VNEKIKKWLQEQMEEIKTEFARVEVTPRQFSRFGGDTEYAETELILRMDNDEIWDGWTDEEIIYNHPLFLKAVRWQAAYNTVA
jgi:hypothetical protein